MKEENSKNVAKYFVNAASFKKTKRSDGRDYLEARDVSLNFGLNWGSCIVSLGKTRVVTKVSCDIEEPEESRPNEGKISIYMELNTIVAVYLETNRRAESTILVHRMLEKFIKDSECVDLKSLCIVPKEKVWNIKVDLCIISLDGSLIDCASIAVLVALMHFRRPDVTLNGTEIVIHPTNEKDPLPLTLLSSPISVSFVTLRNGDTLIDPSHVEENTSVAQFSIGVYSLTEQCFLRLNYLSNASFVVKNSKSVGVNYAVKRVTRLIKQIKQIVAKDINIRCNEGNNYGCHRREHMISGKITNPNDDNISN